ncbi:MAG: chemotaxis protein [Planctomycetaceae bacterium]|nr:MAG: chemotaxis protein [Planctomycetaceae bacterium]
MGEIGVCRDTGCLRTLLGSCLGVALYDRRVRVAGLAHIVLPKSKGVPELPGKYADTALPELLRRMQALSAGETLKLSAKLAGGANMFNSASSPATIGEMNITAVERILGELRIPVVGRHLGGEQGRRMMLDASTGLVTIEIAGSQATVL